MSPTTSRMTATMKSHLAAVPSPMAAATRAAMSRMIQSDIGTSRDGSGSSGGRSGFSLPIQYPFARMPNVVIGPCLRGYSSIGGDVTRRLRMLDGGRAPSAHSRSDQTSTTAGEGSFTIDVHRARTRHFDLRLVRGGVVSLWAVVSPIPAPGDGAQTAIHIDELPISVRGGIVDRSHRDPWDDGLMTVRTWKEGESAVVTLHGSLDGGLGGSRTVSLRHVGSVWQDDDHWTITALDDSS